MSFPGKRFSSVFVLASLGAIGCGNRNGPARPGDERAAIGGSGANSSGGAEGEGATFGSTGWSSEPSFLKASNADPGDMFGVSLDVSADGSCIAVGANREASAFLDQPADNSVPDSGAVYLFESSGGAWAESALVKASNPGQGDGFGSTLALSADGRTLVVGAPFESSSATGVNGAQTDDAASAAGAVYVFIRGDAGWRQEAYLKASNVDSGDTFGTSVALSADGNTLAVGAEGEASSAALEGDVQADNSAPEAGAVYVFQRASDEWQQQAYLKASNAESGDHFGVAVALSADGRVLAVGAEWEDSAAAGVDGDQEDNSSPFAGAVYVFLRNDGPWEQHGYLKPALRSGEVAVGFGGAVSLSADGNTLAVGAAADASSVGGINGNVSDASAPFSGAAYVFARTTGAFQQTAYLKASHPTAGDEFGHHLDLSADGKTLVVGAALEAGGGVGWMGDPKDESAPEAGAAYIFVLDSAILEQGYVKASNTAAGARFGWSLGLSADGSVLGVGASREGSDGDATGSAQDGRSAPRAGAAYLYSRSPPSR